MSVSLTLAAKVMGSGEVDGCLHSFTVQVFRPGTYPGLLALLKGHAEGLKLPPPRRRTARQKLLAGVRLSIGRIWYRHEEFELEIINDDTFAVFTAQAFSRLNVELDVPDTRKAREKVRRVMLADAAMREQLDRTTDTRAHTSAEYQQQLEGELTALFQELDIAVPAAFTVSGNTVTCRCKKVVVSHARTPGSISAFKRHFWKCSVVFSYLKAQGLEEVFLQWKVANPNPLKRKRVVPEAPNSDDESTEAEEVDPSAAESNADTATGDADVQMLAAFALGTPVEETP